MGFYRWAVRPILFKFDPEKCHNGSIRALEMAGRVSLAGWGLGAGSAVKDKRLETTVCGVRFNNPVGLAAGFDKSGRAVKGLAGLGFGHVEIGSVSAEASAGNAKLRLWRLIEDRALLVHYGVPNDGAEVVAKRLAAKNARVPVGINIVKTNKGSGAATETDEEVVEDYVRSVRALKDSGSYLALNLSCPNTTHGRDFFSVRGNTRILVGELAKLDIRVPVLLKVSAAGGVARIESLLEEVEGLAVVSGFAFNLTSEKPGNLKSARGMWENRRGAVSGKPVEAMINAAISNLHARIPPGRYQIIGSGGIFGAEDAYLKIRLGAALVQVLTALVYEGPGVVNRINRGLCRLLKRDGFSTIAEAVGTLKNPVGAAAAGFVGAG